MNIQRSIQADDGRQKRPGAECAAGEGRHLVGGEAVDFARVGEGAVGLDGVGDGDDGDLGGVSGWEVVWWFISFVDGRRVDLARRTRFSQYPCRHIMTSCVHVVYKHECCKMSCCEEAGTARISADRVVTEADSIAHSTSVSRKTYQ